MCLPALRWGKCWICTAPRAGAAGPRPSLYPVACALRWCRVEHGLVYTSICLTHLFVPSIFVSKIKLLCSTRAKQSCVSKATIWGGGSARCCARWGASGRWRRLPGRAGAGPGPQTPHARARRPHWSPQSHAGRWRGRPHPPSEPPSSGLSAGSGRDRSMSTLKVYSTSVTGSREVSGAWGGGGAGLGAPGVPLLGGCRLPTPGVPSAASHRASSAAWFPSARVLALCAVCLPPKKRGEPPVWV